MTLQTHDRSFRKTMDVLDRPASGRRRRWRFLRVATPACLAGMCLLAASAQTPPDGRSAEAGEKRSQQAEAASAPRVGPQSLRGPSETVPRAMRNFEGEVAGEIRVLDPMPAVPVADATDRTDPSSSSSESASHQYRIGHGDVLGVNVWREPEASAPRVTVRSDGKISVPLVKEVTAVGLTPTELSRELAKAYSQFISSPEVTVVVQEIHSERVYVVGGVANPGARLLQSPMTVLQVLAESGGFTEFAKTGKIYILRRDGEKTVQLPVDYRAILRGKSLDQNILVRPGDTIVVPQ